MTEHALLPVEAQFAGGAAGNVRGSVPGGGEFVVRGNEPGTPAIAHGGRELRHVRLLHGSGPAVDGSIPAEVSCPFAALLATEYFSGESGEHHLAAGNAHVRRDVQASLITRERAREVYGVIVEDDQEDT